LKVLLGGVAGSAFHRGRFAAEVSALANLRHPNIVTVFEVGEVSGAAFFSMEYAPNGTLAGRLKRGPLPVRDGATLVGKLAEATEAAHRLGVLHRDIKPGNVLIGADGEPKLSDFGLAKWVNSEEGLTAAGAVMGTPSYMSPEQARGGKEVGPATDVYALGATLYECLTGRPPFHGSEAYSILQGVLTLPPDPPQSVRPEVPAELEAICLKCLEKDQARRYSSAQQLADDLLRWQKGESTLARPLKRWQRAWRRVRRNWKPIAAGVLLGATGIGLVALSGDRQSVEPPAPAAEIEAALSRGEPVTLIGAGGRPKYQRWVVGVGETSDAQPDQPFVVQCSKSGMLELTPDSHSARFRISAEFQQDASLSVESSAGIYFGHNIGVPGPAGSVERVIVIRFLDDQINNTPVHRQGDPLYLEDRLIVRTENAPFRFLGPQVRTHFVQEAKPADRSRPWRKVVAEVTPEEIRVFWRNPSGSLDPIRGGPIPRASIVGDAKIHADQLADKYPGVKFAAVDYTPRGGVGLYLRDVRVFFKNVVLEP
ncbi:MAG TPA: serine/threonine-protein kinase, partial [Gemmataceae bacterium]|nr:serine/threonine-protein kinase [Gemmataceae bacterium]